MQSDTNVKASPRNNPRRPHNKQNRADGVAQHQDVLSDSNLPNVTTPRSKKTPQPPHNGARASSGIAHTHSHPVANGKGRPASATASNGNLATPSKPSYAGAAFHASPAPSSLPVPKFFSKSVPVVEPSSGFKARMEKERDNIGPSIAAVEASPVPFSGLKPAKSPLDMFFNADREEKAKKLGNSDKQNPPQDLRSQTPSRPREMFMMELDDTSSPAGSNAGTPTFNRQKSAPGYVPQSQSPDQARRAADTQSLKSFLNLTAGEATNGSAASPSRSPFTPNSRPAPGQNNPSLATPSRPDDQYYGNRNLSPLFQASRSPQPHPSPQHHLQPHPASFRPFENHQHTQRLDPTIPSHNYASPSKSPLSLPQQQYQQQQRYPGQFQQSSGMSQHEHPPGPAAPFNNTSQQQHSSNGTGNTASDMRSMEERMKKMLNMSNIVDVGAAGKR